MFEVTQLHLPMMRAVGWVIHVVCREMRPGLSVQLKITEMV